MGVPEDVATELWEVTVKPIYDSRHRRRGCGLLIIQQQRIIIPRMCTRPRTNAASFYLKTLITCANMRGRRTKQTVWYTRATYYSLRPPGGLCARKYPAGPGKREVN